MIFVFSLGVYFLTGLVFAIVFFFVGYKLILADAAGSKLPVRLLWFPGAAAIWPLLVFKWLNRDPKEDAREDQSREGRSREDRSREDRSREDRSREDRS